VSFNWLKTKENIGCLVFCSRAVEIRGLNHHHRFLVQSLDPRVIAGQRVVAAVGSPKSAASARRCQRRRARPIVGTFHSDASSRPGPKNLPRQVEIGCTARSWVG
jgi:hypothetical protein